MKIYEIFKSFQGEGSFLGFHCTFIRTAGCSLHCPFCDSKITWAEGSNDMSPADIAEAVHTPLVVITGGEPTEQPISELTRLVQLLHEKGCTVCLESNGTYEHYDELGFDWVVVSPKAGAMYCVFPKGVNELKYVVTKDFNASVAIPESIRKKFEGHIWLQPCDGDDPKVIHAKIAKYVAEDTRLRAGIQLHKVYEVA